MPEAPQTRSQNDRPLASRPRLEDTYGRFFVHWIAATFGTFLRSLLPVIVKWTDPTTPVAFPRWWAFLVLAGLVCLLAGAVNSDLPILPRQIVKSIAIGFAVDVVPILGKLSVFATHL